MNVASTANEPFACALKAWQEHHAELRRYLARRASDRDLADDLLQEVFIKVLRQGGRFCALDNPRAWLFEVARNVWIDHLRAEKDRVPLSEDLAEEKEPLPPVDELAACMERSLAALAPEDAEVIRRCDLEGMKLKAFADSKGLTVPAVKSRIQRARRRLREILVERCQIRFDDAGQVCCHVPARLGPA